MYKSRHKNRITCRRHSDYIQAQMVELIDCFKQADWYWCLILIENENVLKLNQSHQDYICCHLGIPETAYCIRPTPDRPQTLYMPDYNKMGAKPKQQTSFFVVVVRYFTPSTLCLHSYLFFFPFGPRKCTRDKTAQWAGGGGGGKGRGDGRERRPPPPPVNGGHLKPLHDFSCNLWGVHYMYLDLAHGGPAIGAPGFVTRNTTRTRSIFISKTSNGTKTRDNELAGAAAELQDWNSERFNARKTTTNRPASPRARLWTDYVDY